MRKILMLSARRDPDLVAIYNSIGKQAFIKLTKDALRSCIRPNYKICDQITIKNEIQNDKKIINVELSITSTNDTDICELLQNVKDRQANAFIRTCIRFYIGRVTILQTYLNNDFTALITAPQIIQVFGGFNLSSEAKPRAKRSYAPRGRKKTTNKQQLSDNKKENIEIEKDNLSEVVVTNKNEEVIPEYKNFIPENTSSNKTDTVDEQDEMLNLLNSLLG